MDDWRRARTSGYVLSYPETDSISLVNVGSNSVLIETLGGNGIDKQLEPLDCVSCPSDNITSGRIRVVYVDLKEGRRYDEGCALLY